MPYKSKAQEAYFNTHRKQLEAQGVNVGEWNNASRGAKLPRTVGSRGKKLPASVSKRSKRVKKKK